MRVLVLGGGVSGLTTAHYLRRALARFPCDSTDRHTVTVLEATGETGGWVSSTRHAEQQANVVFEHGPRTMRPAGVAGFNTLLLLEQLGLQDRVRWVSRQHAAARNRLLCVDGRLHRLPSTPLSLLRRLPPFTRPLAASAWTDLLSPAPADDALDDDSMWEFTARRFGAEVARYLADPLVRGVCAGDARRVSVRLLFDRLFEYERAHGSVIGGAVRERWRTRGLKTPLQTAAEQAELSGEGGALWQRAVRERWAVWTLQGGLQTLTDRLTETAESVETAGSNASHSHSVCVELLKNVEAVSLQLVAGDCGDGAVSVTSADGRRWHADRVVAAVPANVLASLLSPPLRDDDPSAVDTQDTTQHAFARDLSSIEYASTAVINLEFEREAAGDGRFDAFGYLVPSCQPSAGVLGVTFDSCVFPPLASDPLGCGVDTSRLVFTVMAGGVDHQRHLGERPSEAFLVRLARDELRRTLGVTRRPRRAVARFLARCIPQYHVGHRALVARLRQTVAHHRWPLVLAGAAYDGISVNDCIASARRAAETIAAH